MFNTEFDASSFFCKNKIRSMCMDFLHIVDSQNNENSHFFWTISNNFAICELYSYHNRTDSTS